MGWLGDIGENIWREGRDLAGGRGWENVLAPGISIPLNQSGIDAGELARNPGAVLGGLLGGNQQSPQAQYGGRMLDPNANPYSAGGSASPASLLRSYYGGGNTAYRPEMQSLNDYRRQLGYGAMPQSRQPAPDFGRGGSLLDVPEVGQQPQQNPNIAALAGAYGSGLGGLLERIRGMSTGIYNQYGGGGQWAAQNVDAGGGPTSKVGLLGDQPVGDMQQPMQQPPMQQPQQPQGLLPGAVGGAEQPAMQQPQQPAPQPQQPQGLLPGAIGGSAQLPGQQPQQPAPQPEAQQPAAPSFSGWAGSFLNSAAQSGVPAHALRNWNEILGGHARRLADTARSSGFNRGTETTISWGDQKYKVKLSADPRGVVTVKNYERV